jgi:hypothetical protein
MYAEWSVEPLDFNGQKMGCVMARTGTGTAWETIRCDEVRFMRVSGQNSFRSFVSFGLLGFAELS